MNPRRGAFFAILGSVVMFAMNLGDLWHGLQSGHWPVTEGTIQSSAINRHSYAKGGTYYSADVTYDYQVAGVKFSGDQLAFGDISWTWKNEDILARYPVGKKVQVHYSANNPQLAVLETGVIRAT